MLKKSFIIVIIQLLGSVLGLVTIYLVAGTMEPEVYSLIGVYTIITNIVVTFSDLGIETTMMREALLWIQNKDYNKVKEYSTQAIMSRVFAFCIILPFLICYILFINKIKYSGERTLLLLLALIGAQIASINNAMSLIIRSRGGYVFSQIASTTNNYIVKFLGLGLYFVFGANVYLYFYILSSIPLCVIYSLKLKDLLDVRFIMIRPMLKKVLLAKYLWLRTDLDYVKNNADALLVSALFPPAIMGSYAIFKNLEQLLKNLVEGFFDVLSQNTVKYKGNFNKLKEQERKIKMIRNVIIALVFACTCIFSINPKFFIKLIHLTKYNSIIAMMYCLAIITVIHLLGKYEINALAFFASSKLNFNMGLIVFGSSVISFSIIELIPNINGMLLQRIIVYFVYTTIAILILKKHREDIYSSIKK